MNILPLIFSFFLVFCVLLSSIWHTARCELSSAKALEGSFNAYVKMAGGMEERIYKKATFKRSSPATPPKPRKKYPDFRSMKYRYEVTKLSLHPCQEKIAMAYQGFLIKTLKNLMSDLYGESSLSKELEKIGAEKLSEAIVSAAGRAKDDLGLASLVLKDQDMQVLFYRMCKGTASGYPSLLDYVTLASFDNTFAVVFPRASAVLLKAVFGQESADSIMAEEKKKYLESNHSRVLKKEELSIVLAKSSIPMDMSVFDAAFSHKALQREGCYLKAIDDKTGIKKEHYISKKKALSSEPPKAPGG